MSRAAASAQPSMRLAIVGAALLVLVAAATFYYATVAARRSAPGTDGLTVTITGKTCEPAEISVPAGLSTFRIVNRSDRAVEWEILDGVLVVAERENIAPGITQTLQAKLAPGSYEITCGLLSNPRGRLVVTPSAAAAAEAARPPLTAFIGPLAEYQVYLGLQAAELVEATGALAEAVKAGDLVQARELYLPARIAYARLEAATPQFGDLATAIDGSADYLEQREADPAFKGFHRLEIGLFAPERADGHGDGHGDGAALGLVADGLLADTTALQAALASRPPAPEQLSQGAARLMASLAQARIPRGTDPYAQIDLAVLAANLEGSRKAVELLRPLLTKARPELMAELDARLAAAAAGLDGLRRGDGYPAYGQVSGSARAALAQRMQALADTLAQVDPALGLE